MQRAENTKQEQRTSHQIASKTHHRQHQTDEQHLFSGERIRNISAERAHQQCRYRITRQHQTNRIFARSKLLGEVQWEQRREQIKENAIEKFAVITRQ